ncbi:MAG: zinc ribbon domain-containing protein [Actinomycetota bacterium]|nr:zinc ribbon domain-containing protein [Actinomycetota bacterium]
MGARAGRGDVLDHGRPVHAVDHTYLGEARGGGAVREDAHPALVSRALFARCQSRGLQSERTGRLAGRYLLLGVASCAGCGRGLRLTTSGKGRAFYVCRGHDCAERAYAGADALDSHVLRVIEERTNAADPSAWVARPGEDDAEVAEAEHALAEAEEDLDSFLADTTLRRTLGAERHAEAAGNYVAVVNKCQADLASARERTSGSFELVGRLWNTEWGHPERKEWVERMVERCPVRRGREPLSERAEVELP